MALRIARLGFIVAGLLLVAPVLAMCGRETATPPRPGPSAGTASPVLPLSDQVPATPTTSAGAAEATRAPTATPSRQRPRVPSKEAAYRPQWTEADLRLLDAWGDAGGDEQDLVALFFKATDGLLRFRVDFLDLRADGLPNFNLALDFVRGGVTAESPASLASDMSWDMLIRVTAGKSAQVLSSSLEPIPGAVAGVASDATLDYMTVELRRDALPLFTGGPFRFQVLALADGDSQVADRTEVTSSDAIREGKAKLVVRFGNVLGPVTPSGVASWYDSREADSDGKVKPKGWRYLLDAAERYWIPIALDVKQTNYLGWTEDLGLYERLRSLHSAGLLDMPDTLAYGHFMAWQPQDVDAKAIALSRDLFTKLGLPPSPIFAPYEGQMTVADLRTVKDAGYESVVIGSEQEYFRMFGEADDGPVHAAGKLHRANGINLVFQRFPWSFVWEPRWGDDPYKGWNESDTWRGTDGGLNLWFRRNLLDLAMDPDQEQVLTLGTDIGVTPWGFQEVVDANLRWIAEHPWVKVIRQDKLFDQGWRVMDHGDLGLPPEALLFRFPLEGDQHYNAYFSQFYYGGVADGHSPFAAKGQTIESYADYIPYWRDGLPIPSGLKMGDDRAPGTIIYETLKNLRSAPDNGLTTLAWLSYFTSIGEQTFHSVKDHTPHDPDAESGNMPYGGPYLHPAAKMRANNLRQVNKIITAAQWAAATAEGKVPSEAKVEARDLDLDGEDEYVMSNDRLFLVFEEDGGRLEYGFAFVPGRGPVQFIAPVAELVADPMFFGSNWWDWTKGEAGQVPYSPAWVGAFVEQLSDGTSLAFAQYGAAVAGNSITFTSPDGKIRKTFSLEQKGQSISVRYEVSRETLVEVNLALDPLRMWTARWSESLEEVQTSSRLGMRYRDGPSATLSLEGKATWQNPEVSSFLDSPGRWEWRHEPSRTDYPSGNWFPYPYANLVTSGQGKFALRLSVEP